MFAHFVIIFALALVFGVIKVDQLKQWGDKALSFAKKNLNKDLVNKDENPSDDQPEE